jgi:ABC-type polysaccharide/polyol phosphate export permease
MQVWRVVPDLIRARYLLRDLVSKELRARYRNAMMGILWAVLQPVLMTLILTFVFGFLFKNRIVERGVQTDHPFAVFLLCGLVPWHFMAMALSCGTNSLLESQELIKKVYFPREVIPLAAVANCCVNFLVGFITVLIVIAAMEGPSALGVGVLLVFPVFCIQLMMIVGLVLILSTGNIFYRDVAYMVEVALSFGFYATPVFYPVSLVEKSAAAYPMLVALYKLNPMVGIVTSYRQVLLDNRLPDLMMIGWPIVASAGLLAVGVWVFRRNAARFADYL